MGQVVFKGPSQHKILYVSATFLYKRRFTKWPLEKETLSGFIDFEQMAERGIMENI